MVCILCQQFFFYFDELNIFFQAFSCFSKNMEFRGWGGGTGEEKRLVWESFDEKRGSK